MLGEAKRSVYVPLALIVHNVVYIIISVVMQRLSAGFSVRGRSYFDA